MKDFFLADISGGASVYLNKFFTRGCMHLMQDTNEQFLNLLQMFCSLEKLFDELQKALYLFEKYLQTEGFDEIPNKVSWEILDKWQTT